MTRKQLADTLTLLDLGTFQTAGHATLRSSDNMTLLSLDTNNYVVTYQGQSTICEITPLQYNKLCDYFSLMPVMVTRTEKDKKVKVTIKKDKKTRVKSEPIVLTTLKEYPAPTEADLKVIPFSELQGFMYWRINKTYNEMLGHKSKHSLENYSAKIEEKDTMKVNSWGLAMSQAEFREEAYQELSIIYCETIAKYDPEKGIPFFGFLNFKAGDLGGRMFRLMSHSSNVKHREEYAKESADTSLINWRLSLSLHATELLAILETGIGFKLKKTEQASKAYSCHMGMQNFWQTFLKDELTLAEFRLAYRELKQTYSEIDYNDTTYVLTEVE